MADKKITDLTELTEVASDDYLEIVDTSANASKKISYGNLIGNSGGWIPVSDTWTYKTATTITVPSGATNIYSVGMGIRLTANGVVKQAYIIKVEDTKLTVAGNALTNHTFSAISYAPNPGTAVGFPGVFAYVPSGISDNNAGKLATYTVVGRRCFVDMLITFQGAITFTTMPSLPIPCHPDVQLGHVNTAIVGSGSYYDDGTSWGVNGIFPTIDPSDRSVVFIKLPSGTDMMDATHPITWTLGDFLELHFNYAI